MRCGHCVAPFENVRRKPKKGETYRKRITQCIARYQRKIKSQTVYNNGVQCKEGNYSTEELEARVLNQLSIFQSNQQALKDHINKHEEPVIDTSEFEKQLESIEHKIQKLSDLYMNDLITLDEMKEKSENLKKSRTALENKIRGINVTVPTDTLNCIRNI
ncbi:hypothetical protein ACIQ1D_01630 [Lysinibacillus xylanilyticus]|uniref:hypothetical protein n=1 Tax=Lysinibacillus xylanilyticus TaxID=582475 RepID=UPI0038156D54